MKIIRPKRFLIMLRDARLATRNTPVRFASMTLVKFSSLIRMISMSALRPALATSTSTGPWCSSTWVNAASTAALSVTSHWTANRSSPGAPDPRCVTATLCPSAASRRATASPIPRFPPVTSTERETNGGRPAAVSPAASGEMVSVMSANLMPERRCSEIALTGEAPHWRPRSTPWLWSAGMYNPDADLGDSNAEEYTQA